MELTTNQKIVSSSTVLLLVIGIVFGSGFIGQENVYACEDLNLAMQCDKLSSVNDLGFQTRCYYFSEEKNRTTYKSCSSGWLKYTPDIKEEIKDIEINETWNMCKVIKGNSFIKECLNDNNETYLYWID